LEIGRSWRLGLLSRGGIGGLERTMFTAGRPVVVSRTWQVIGSLADPDIVRCEERAWSLELEVGDAIAGLRGICGS
jgi:hypothetical protein